MSGSGIFEVARVYQQETGIGLPFSGDDDATMLEALRNSFRKQQKALEALQRRDRIVREFIDAYPNCELEPGRRVVRYLATRFGG